MCCNLELGDCHERSKHESAFEKSSAHIWVGLESEKFTLSE